MPVNNNKNIDFDDNVCYLPNLNEKRVPISKIKFLSKLKSNILIPTPPQSGRIVTPRQATPRQATPRQATPRQATPRQATPRLKPQLVTPQVIDEEIPLLPPALKIAPMPTHSLDKSLVEQNDETNCIEMIKNDEGCIVSKEDKQKYGEVYTPFNLIREMFSMFPDEHIFKNPNSKWLDPGAGSGHFSIAIYYKLLNGLKRVIKNDVARHNHIIKNMIYMVEIKPDNILKLRRIFGEEANIIEIDYIRDSVIHGDNSLSDAKIDTMFSLPIFQQKWKIKFDYIIGNPPYNFNGQKKVPTNNNIDKKKDGETVWFKFIKRSLVLLKPGGHLLFIVPSIWMKPDKERIYDLLTQYKILKIRCLSNTETNKIFSGEAQTPTCYFLLKNKQANICDKYSNDPVENVIALYDKDRSEYIPYSFSHGEPIPLFGQSVIQKLKPFKTELGSLKVHKTNLPSKNASISKEICDGYSYKNIRTCIIDTELNPELVLEYSKSPLMFHGKPKLVLPHKMYGFPFLDKTGKYGISNRDNYVIMGKSIIDLKKIQAFLSTKTALYIFEATRYRMKYLEKYAFELIPDITRASDFPKTINDETIADYFGFDDDDRLNIQRLHKKKYTFSYKGA